MTHGDLSSRLCSKSAGWDVGLGDISWVWRTRERPRGLQTAEPPPRPRSKGTRNPSLFLWLGVLGPVTFGELAYQTHVHMRRSGGKAKPLCSVEILAKDNLMMKFRLLTLSGGENRYPQSVCHRLTLALFLRRDLVFLPTYLSGGRVGWRGLEAAVHPSRAQPGGFVFGHCRLRSGLLHVPGNAEVPQKDGGGTAALPAGVLPHPGHPSIFTAESTPMPVQPPVRPALWRPPRSLGSTEEPLGAAVCLPDENCGHLMGLESRLRQTVVKMTHRCQERFYVDFKYANGCSPTCLSIGGHDLPLGGGSAWRPGHLSFRAPPCRREAPTASESGPPSAIGGPLHTVPASLLNPAGQRLLLSYAPS